MILELLLMGVFKVRSRVKIEALVRWYILT